MRNTILLRAGVATAVCMTAMAFSSSAFAALKPTFSVGVNSQTKHLAIDASAGKAPDNDWVGRMQVYVPSGFKIAAPAVGAQVGTIVGQSVATQISGSSLVRFSGTITAISPSDPGMAGPAQGCATGTHVAAWMVKAPNESTGTAWEFPIFVDQTTGSETAFGQYKLTVCFGPKTDLEPNGDGNKLVSMSLDLTPATKPAKAGDYKFHSLWTPFAADLKSLNDAGTVETQSTAHVANALLTISAKKSGSHVTLTGKLLVGGEAMDGVKVAVKHRRLIGRLITMAVPKTTSNGTWSVRTVLKQQQWFQAGATIGKQDLGASGCIAAFSYPCVNATIGGTSVSSPMIHVR